MQKMEMTYPFYGSFIRSECKKFVQNVSLPVKGNSSSFLKLLLKYDRREFLSFIEL